MSWWSDFDRGMQAAKMEEERDPFESEGWLAGWDSYWNEHIEEPDESDIYLALL